MPKPILITGASGMVGSHFDQRDDCVLLPRRDLDVTDQGSIASAFQHYQPRAVIHLAALTNVDYCESHPHEAYEINAVGARNIAIACANTETHLVAVSTAAVFSGRGKRPFSIDDAIDPVNVYARSKAAGEFFVRDIAPKHTIVRTGWLFGGYEGDHKFVGMICRQIWEKKKKIYALNTTKGCPTFTKDLVDVLLRCVELKRYGIVHAVNAGSATRLQIAEEIIQLLNSSATVHRIGKQNLQAFTAPRPTFEVVAQSIPMRSWQSALAEYIQTWQELRSSQSSA